MKLINVIVFYDVSDNKIRNKIVKVLEEYGIRMQKSVFQCQINMKNYIQMKIKLGGISKYEKEVSIVIAEIENTSKVYYLNGKEAFNIKDSDIII